MGLAEPRKRIKLSHDPNNLTWSTSHTTSFGSRYMQQSGWTPGTALGASSTPTPAHEATAAKVKIAIKDNTLGLGANLKSKDVAHQRTGLDAFQGLLGRLNAKGEEEVKAVGERVENKKLAMFTMGRWGGMVFVPGGMLVQEDPKKLEIAKPVAKVLVRDENVESDCDEDQSEEENQAAKTKGVLKKNPDESPEERAKRKADKSQRKEEKKVRKEVKRLKKLQKEGKPSATTSGTTSAIDTPDLTETDSGASTPVSVPGKTISITSVTQEKLRNGRHILRGRNIQAKRLAFSDSKGLDQIFMREQKQEA